MNSAPAVADVKTLHGSRCGGTHARAAAIGARPRRRRADAAAFGWSGCDCPWHLNDVWRIGGGLEPCHPGDPYDRVRERLMTSTGPCSLPVTCSGSRPSVGCAPRIRTRRIVLRVRLRSKSVCSCRASTPDPFRVGVDNSPINLARRIASTGCSSSATSVVLPRLVGMLLAQPARLCRAITELAYRPKGRLIPHAVKDTLPLSGGTPGHPPGGGAAGIRTRTMLPHQTTEGSMNIRALNPEQTLWIERCARRLKRLGPLFTHIDAISLAFDLYRVWPAIGPKRAADAFMAPERFTA